jgi:hypothetical protein
LCVVGEVFGKELEGDMATKPQVFGLVYATVPSVEPGLVRCSLDSMVAPLRPILSGLKSELRQPKVQNLGLTSVRDEDFRGLDSLHGDPQKELSTATAVDRAGWRSKCE